MNDLKLFSINLSRTWQSEASVFVLANSEKEAEDAAKRIINLSPYDSCDSEIETHSKELSFLSLGDIKNHKDYWFIAPDKHGCFDWFEFEEFKSFISDEKLEEIRIKKIEENNGQLSLLKAE